MSECALCHCYNTARDIVDFHARCKACTALLDATVECTVCHYFNTAEDIMNCHARCRACTAALDNNHIESSEISFEVSDSDSSSSSSSDGSAWTISSDIDTDEQGTWSDGED
jgi:hypothetical protein